MKDDLRKRFVRQLDAIDRTRGRIDRLHKKKRLRERDVELAYEALFLKAVTSFESLLEQLFTAIVMGKGGYAPSRVASKISVRSLKTLIPIITEGRSYAKWLPYEAFTKKRAKRLLKSGRPFSEISKPQLQFLEQVMATRNAIAHTGRHAQGRFEEEVLTKFSVGAGQRRPAAFLRTIGAPPATRFEAWLVELATIAGDLM